MNANQPAVKIILTDDDADDRIVFREAFEELKIRNELTLFADGDELMDYLHSENIELPQILFLDLNMPRKSGLQCLREIRDDEKLKDLSVAIYSTSSSETEIDKTFASGANLYIKKPTEFEKLKKIITEVIERNWYEINRGNRAKFFMNG